MITRRPWLDRARCELPKWLVEVLVTQGETPCDRCNVPRTRCAGLPSVESPEVRIERALRELGGNLQPSDHAWQAKVWQGIARGRDRWYVRLWRWLGGGR